MVAKLAMGEAVGSEGVDDPEGIAELIVETRPDDAWGFPDGATPAWGLACCGKASREMGATEQARSLVKARCSMNNAHNVLRGSLARGAVFLGLWLILSGLQPAELLVGVFAAGMATWASVRLSPPGQWRIRPRALAAFGLRFLHQSVTAGTDVAWRALRPRQSLRPGFVIYRTQLSQGPTQAAFCGVMSLVPGTLPSGRSDNGALVIHCLDVEQPVAAQSAVEEELLARALGVWPHDD
jgi:multicomponent Na+:H+ antiporter subunit E